MTAAALTDQQYDLVRMFALGDSTADLAKATGTSRRDVVDALTELCEMNRALAGEAAYAEERRRNTPPASIEERAETFAAAVAADVVDGEGPARDMVEAQLRDTYVDVDQNYAYADYRAFRCRTCGRIAPEPCPGHDVSSVTVRIFDTVVTGQ